MTLSNSVYIQLKDVFQGKKGEQVLIKDLAVLITDSNLKKEIENLRVLNIDKSSNTYIVVSVLTIIEEILELYPHVRIYPIGNSEILIKTESSSLKHSNSLWNMLKLISICSLLFVGAGLAIMNFHADVNMDEVHRTIYKLVTGIDDKKPIMIHIPYSIGIGIGMAIFFNHIIPKKYSNEPSPMEIEMFSYRKSIDEFLLANEQNTEENR